MPVEMEILREVAWTEWDPIGLLAVDADWRAKSFKDEYDTYMKRCVRMVNRGQTEGQIAGYLMGVTKYNMGMGGGLAVRKSAVNTARAVIALVERQRKRPK